MEIELTLKLVITSTPPGQAPFWVREKWVGLVIPLVQKKEGALVFYTTGLFSQPNGFFSCLFDLVMGKMKREKGFIVESKVAVELLAITAPEAASWWRENTPHLLKSGQFFVFNECCGHSQNL